MGGGQQGILERVRSLKANDEWIALSELLSFGEIGSTGSRPQIACALAAAFVQSLVENHGRERFLEAYLSLTNPGGEAVRNENTRLLEAVYGTSLGKLERAWMDFIGG